MMGEEGKPGKKVRLRGRGKRPDRPPENPVVDVRPQRVFFFSGLSYGEKEVFFLFLKLTDMSIMVFNVSSFH